MTWLINTRAFEKFWAIAGGVSIQVKVLGIVLGVIVVLGVFVTLQLRQVLYTALQHDLIEQGNILNSHTAELVGDALATNDIDAVNTLIIERRDHYSSDTHNTVVEYIIVVGTQGEMITQSTTAALPQEIITDNDALPTDHSTLRHFTTNSLSIIEFSHPLTGGLGTVRMGLSESGIWNTVNGVSNRIFAVTLVMIAFGFAAAIFLTWILTRPILSLVAATHAVEGGDYTQQVPRWANDEIGILADAFNSMTRALAQADKERAERENLRTEYINRVIVAQESERKRIARELHDSTSQSLTSMLVGLRNLEQTGSIEDAHTHIGDLRKIVNQTLDEVHALAWQLRPSVLDDLGLIAALERYIADYQQRYDINIEFVAFGLTERLPMETETSVYRIVQEGLTNIARHSHAQTASVLVEQRQQVMRIIIEDDGVGFDTHQLQFSKKSLGLQGIRERAGLFDGKLTIESQPEKGTTLYIEIPLEETTEQTPSLGETS